MVKPWRGPSTLPTLASSTSSACPSLRCRPREHLIFGQVPLGIGSMGVPLGIQVYFDKKRLVEQSLRDMSSLFHYRLLAVVTWTGWLWPWQERLRDSLEAGFLQADLFLSFKEIVWRTFKLETEAIYMPWSFYWPLITIMIFKNRLNQIVCIELIRRWEESKPVKVSDLRPEKTTIIAMGLLQWTQINSMFNPL